MNGVPVPSRRRLLFSGAGIAGLVAFGKAGANTSAAPAAAPARRIASNGKPLPDYVNWKDPQSMIVHSANTIETRRSAFGTSVITPNEQVYIRNNLPPPPESLVENRDAWEVQISGVKSPRTMTVAELKTLGVETVAMVLQCSGNGRGLGFTHKPSGTQWQVGAAGCVVWSGVPVRKVVDALGGLVDGVRFMTGTGGEKLPEGVDPLSVMVERSVPLEAMQDALLAWEMNGVPVSLAHGGPLRLIVPGYTGVNNVKYVRALSFTPKESEARIQQSSYRMSPIGTKGSPEWPSVWKMTPKSWVNTPNAETGPVKAGAVQITGVAFGGMERAEKVEVSIDGGRTWQEASFIGPDLGKYAWRQFVLSTRLAPGDYTIASRVTDAAGNVQSEQRIDNERGYLNTSWRDHAVRITVV